MTRISKTIIFGLKVVIQEVVITSVFFDWAVDSYPPIIISLNQLNFRLSPVHEVLKATQRNDPVMIRLTLDGFGRPYLSSADDNCPREDLELISKKLLTMINGGGSSQTVIKWLKLRFYDFKLKRNEIVLTQLEWLKYLICSKGLSNM